MVVGEECFRGGENLEDTWPVMAEAAADNEENSFHCHYPHWLGDNDQEDGATLGHGLTRLKCFWRWRTFRHGNVIIAFISSLIAATRRWSLWHNDVVIVFSTRIWELVL